MRILIIDRAVDDIERLLKESKESEIIIVSGINGNEYPINLLLNRKSKIYELNLIQQLKINSEFIAGNPQYTLPKLLEKLNNKANLTPFLDTLPKK